MIAEYHLSIEQDVGRFREIVKGHVRRNLRKYMSNGELIGRQGKDLVSIPVPQIELPHFRFNRKQQGGVGQGDGDEGIPIGRGDGDQPGPAGNEPGSHILETEMTLQELAEILGEELELPRIEPKGKDSIEGATVKYKSMRRTGPESLLYFKRTYRAALKRQVISGTYDPKNPAIIPIRDDKYYRSWKVYPKPQNNAVILYMMDVSGSMTRQRKDLVRLTAFWIDTWLQANYKNLVSRYIVHDVAAKEVDAHTFYHLREAGGTRISSAYELCHSIMRQDYPPEEWNVYAFHFSDGENYGGDDDHRCLELLQDDLLPNVNMFCYGQVQGAYGKQFLETLDEIEDEKMVSAKIDSNEHIFAAIKTFLGKGY
jgi:hypothetical protein